MKLLTAQDRFRHLIKMHIKREGCLYTYTPITYEQWNQTVSFFNGRCAYCGGGSYFFMDHFNPTTSGGLCVFGNIIPACPKCNSNKSSKEPYSWMNSYCKKEYIDKVVLFLSLIQTKAIDRRVSL